MDNITIKILARELNLSTAAISKALRDSHEISVPTKQRVRELASRLNYVPNAYAGGLRQKKSKTIAVVVPEVADSFFSKAMNGIEAIAEEKGYHVLIYLTHEHLAREEAILRDLCNGRVDGVLMSLTAETSGYRHIADLQAKNIPLVFFDRVCEQVDTAQIVTNDLESAYQATQHLLQQGCKNIVMLSISESLSISNKRYQGYERALREQCSDFKARNILCSGDPAKDRAMLKKLLRSKNRPDGIIATVEKFTTDVYLSCRALALDIPRDVKVVAFSNLESASILHPSLTTITQPAHDMGKAAATALFNALEKKNCVLRDESRMIPSELIVRGSTVNGM